MLAKRVLDYNHQQQQLPPAQQVYLNLTALLIGDALSSPVIQRTSRHLFSRFNGITDLRHQSQMATLNQHCLESVGRNWSQADSDCNALGDYLSAISGDTFDYDGTIFEHDWDASAQNTYDFLTQSTQKGALYTALHINTSPKSPIFQWSSDAVDRAYSNEELLDRSNVFDALLASKEVGILLYSGEYDMRDGPLTQEPWTKLLHEFSQNPSVYTKFWVQPRNTYYVQDASGSSVVGGYWRDDPSTKLTLLTVPVAGHFVPATNMLTTQNFLADYIKNGKLTCHQKSAFQCEAGPIMCKYMNNCNRHGKCNIQIGRCDCNEGFLGADCSVPIISIPNNGTNASLTNQVTGIDYLYYQLAQPLPAGNNFVITLSASNPIDVYVKTNDNVSEPTEFNHEIAIYKQTRVVLRSEHWPGMQQFTLAVKVNGANLKANTFTQSTVAATFTVVPATEAAPQSAEELAEETIFSTVRGWWNQLSQ